jgi:hypothetical protein
MPGGATTQRELATSDRVTAAGVRVPHARLIVATAALLGCAALLFLARAYTFYFDEWTFITTAPDWTIATFFRPHNEHPSILFRTLYWLLLHTVGLRSYLPYMAVLLAAHFANVILLFTLVRRRAGDLIALAAALLLVLPGGGWEDVSWAFQVAWLASVGLGLAMLITLQGPSTPLRIGLAAVLLAASLAFSGTAVVFALAAVALLWLTPGRRDELVWLAPVGAAVVLWYVLIGHIGNHPDPQPTPANVFLVPPYALWGMSQSIASIIGEAGGVGVAILAVGVAALAWTWWRRRPDPFAVSVAVGLVGFYVVTGLTRAQLGFQQSGSSRYVYIGEVLWLILLADAARALPWHGTWRPVLAACLFLAWFNGSVLLFTYATARNVVMQRQVADYYALADERSDPCLNPNGAVDLLVMPAETAPGRYYRAIDKFGDPRDGMTLRDRASYEAGVRNLRQPNC